MKPEDKAFAVVMGFIVFMVSLMLLSDYANGKAW